MASDRVQSDTPRADLPEQTGRVKPLRPDQVGRTFAKSLIPHVDKIRQLYDRFGIRPYRVFLVHIEWSGERRGIGAAAEISRVEILPVPKIQDMGETSREVASTGVSEEGGLKVSQISARFAEDDLLGRTPDMAKADQPRTQRRNVEFFWEVVQQRGTGKPSRRRYVPDNVGDLRPDAFGWTIHLAKVQGDRSRDATMGPRDR